MIMSSFDWNTRNNSSCGCNHQHNNCPHHQCNNWPHHCNNWPNNPCRCNNWQSNPCNGWCNFLSFTVSGMVMGTDGMPARGVTIEYTLDSQTYTTTTDAVGCYSIMVPQGIGVLIAVAPALGVTVTPAHHFICKVCSDLMGYDFTLSAVVPNMFTVSGYVTGLPNNENVTVIYTVNDQLASTVTDAYGNFSFTAPANANVSVIPSPHSGFSVTPVNYMIASLGGDVGGQNFTYMPTLTR